MMTLDQRKDIPPTLAHKPSCAVGESAPYNPNTGGIDCAGCGRHFDRPRGFNAHVNAARAHTQYDPLIVNGDEMLDASRVTLEIVGQELRRRGLSMTLNGSGSEFEVTVNSIDTEYVSAYKPTLRGVGRKVRKP